MVSTSSLQSGRPAQSTMGHSSAGYDLGHPPVSLPRLKCRPHVIDVRQSSQSVSHLMYIFLHRMKSCARAHTSGGTITPVLSWIGVRSLVRCHLCGSAARPHRSKLSSRLYLHIYASMLCVLAPLTPSLHDSTSSDLLLRSSRPGEWVRGRRALDAVLPLSLADLR